jgi:hypothetical protein
MTKAENTQRELARQKFWRDQGKCYCCRDHRPIGANGYECDICQASRLEAHRRRKGLKPWRPGGRGRPPKSAPRILVKARVLKLAMDRVRRCREQLKEARTHLKDIKHQATRPNPPTP